MTQTELNQLFAEAYRVETERIEYGKAILSRVNLDVSYEAKVQCEQSLKTFPINEDTLTLFQLCIEHRITLHIHPDSIFVMDGDFTFYENYATKEAATCAAMFSALCKLKNIGSE